ncbi:MAG: dihydrolipoamide acetyltransferase family protein [Burkholderiales bacterium]
MSRYVFKLPDVGEGTAEAEISKWHVAVGDRIEEDQPLVDVESEKAMVEIPAPVSGTVVSIHGAIGDKVAVGAELVVIETEAGAEKRTAVESKTEVLAEKTAEVKPKTEAVLASPAVRARARQLGVELDVVHGSGPSGRVTHADLDTVLFARGRGTVSAVRRIVPEKEAGQDPVEEQRIIGIRRKLAERMQEAARRIPHFSYIEEVDVTALEELRLHLNERHAGKRAKLTPLPFIVKAIVRAVAAHPEINARFDDEKGVIQRHAAVHVGIATQTPNGLLVPVLRNAEARDLWDCAAEASRLAGAAREGKATRDELQGSTVTITSLGALGGVASTPIINYPEVAIVGVNRISERPVVRGGSIVVRKMMNLSSSFDHRVIDGWNAAAFIQTVKGFLEQPATLFVE